MNNSIKRNETTDQVRLSQFGLAQVLYNTVSDGQWCQPGQRTFDRSLRRKCECDIKVISERWISNQLGWF